MGISGMEIRTGLSLRSGGRWWGSRVCELAGTPEKTIGSDIPVRNMRTCIFPIRVVFENDLFGGRVLGGVFNTCCRPCILEFDGRVATGLISGLATVSCRSCAHGASAGPVGWEKL